MRNRYVLIAVAGAALLAYVTDLKGWSILAGTAGLVLVVLGSHLAGQDYQKQREDR